MEQEEKVARKKPGVQSTLKVKKTTYRVVEYRELERFVRAAYGREFNFVADQEAHNDSRHEFFVDGTRYDLKADELVKFVRHGGGTYYLAGAILNDFCKRGLIEPGNYLVCVSW